MMCACQLQNIYLLFTMQKKKKILHKLRVIGCDNKLNAIIYKNKIASKAIFFFFFFLILARLLNALLCFILKNVWQKSSGNWIHVF